uniref:histidine phosphatase family protein n=1 Tax=Variovorax sp. dw_954 TaxID=2720078 RepID=UPI001BD35533
ALAGLGTDAEIEPDLAEWDYGDYESLRTSEILNKRPGWDIWQDGCPGVEAPADVADRADRLLLRLRKERGNVALLSHGQFGRVLAARFVVAAARRPAFRARPGIAQHPRDGCRPRPASGDFTLEREFVLFSQRRVVPDVERAGATAS